MRIAIVGGGNFGTAIGNIVAANGHQTSLWMRDLDQVNETLRHGENVRYLPGHPLEKLLVPTNVLEEAVAEAEIVFVTVPSSGFLDICKNLAPFIRNSDLMVSGTKGIEPQGFRLMSQLMSQYTTAEHVGVLSGPNFAEEIAEQQYTGTVLASKSEELKQSVQDVLRSETFRVYLSQDTFGVELGGALKNIYAIICGMAVGLEVGQNTIGMIVTRSLAEMSRFAVSMGANPYTFLGLSGVGDLMVTCTSPLSRNYQLGYKIAQGMSFEDASDELGKLAEGANTLAQVYEKSRELEVYMPLAAGLHQILFSKEETGLIFRALMERIEESDVEFAEPSYWSGGS
jgi:glycerol-3-phosphate dehydrogenase (NAD(P)+)